MSNTTPRRFTLQEQMTFPPPRCEKCATPMKLTWTDDTRASDAETMFTYEAECPHCRPCRMCGSAVTHTQRIQHKYSSSRVNWIRHCTNPACKMNGPAKNFKYGYGV